MGSNETRRMPKHACTGRLVIVALSAQPPGVNELFVLYHFAAHEIGFLSLYEAWATNLESLLLQSQ